MHGTDVAFLIRSLDYGGAERQLTILARELHARGLRVTVLVCYGDGPLGRELVAAGVPLIVLDKRGRWDLLSFLVRLRRVIRDLRPAVVHSYLTDANILSALAGRASPRTRVVWGVRASGLDHSRYDWASSTAFRVSSWLSARADLIIANSHAGATYHQRSGYPASKIHVVPNGIDVGRFSRDEAQGRALRESLGIPDGAPLVGLVARLDPMKGHTTFLRAARDFAARRPDARFVCVGDGPASYREEMHRLGQQLGLTSVLTWLPARPNAVPVYSALDILTTASEFGEGFPNVVAEAMACETPAVVTDIGDSHAVVGPYGLVVRPNDATALASAWTRLLATRADDPELGTRCRQHIEEHFSLAQLVDRTMRLLDSAA